MYDNNDSAAFEEIPTAYFTVNGARTGYQVRNEMNKETGHMKITNSTMKQYSVELSWDIDFGDQDRPDEIEAALQKKEGKFTWTTLQVVKLNTGNNWSNTFEPVPIGATNDEGVFEPFDYRIREVRPLEQNEQPPQTEEEIRQSVSKRTVHNTFDFDKPFITNLIKAFDPRDLMDADATMAYLIRKATTIVIPEPTFVTHIDQYTDTFGYDIEEHDTKYHVLYAHDSRTHKMSIKNTAVIDASIYKHWLNFEDDEMPEAIYVMLMSKVQDRYAEQMGIEEENIYTPVFTCVYGPQLNISNIPGLQLDDKIKDGVKAVLGDGLGTAADGILGILIKKFTNTGIALVEVNEAGGWNSIAQWHTYFGVKQYGSLGVPMDFAGAELITGMLEMVVDALIRQMPIPKINMPIMYDPVNDCFSLKGYCFSYPVIDRDYATTGNIINFKIHWDGSDGNKISGVKHWVDNGAEDRPESVKIHLYAKEKDGENDSDEKTELSVSPVTVNKADGDDWPWSVEIPLNEIIVQEEDKENPENSKITYKEIVIEEEVPDGYEAAYDSYDITNRKEDIPVIEISGQKTWNDDDDAEDKRPSSITVKLLADGKEKTSKKVTEADDWKWTFKDLPKYQNDGQTEIKYTIKEDPVRDYKTTYDGYNITNTWDGGKPTLRIKVNGNSDSRVYNGSTQSFEGSFTATSSDPGFDARKFSYSGSTTASGTDVGDYTRDPVKSSCSYDDDSYNVVWEMGDPVKLTITPASLKIRVTGHTDTVTYNGSEQSVTGYDLRSGSSLFDENRVNFSGEAVAKGTEASDNKYMMGLTDSQFSYEDSNITAAFEITDGWLKIIKTKPYTLTDPVLPEEKPSDEPSGGSSEEPSGSPTDEPAGEPSGDPTGEPSEEPAGGTSEDPAQQTVTPVPTNQEPVPEITTKQHYYEVYQIFAGDYTQFTIGEGEEAVTQDILTNIVWGQNGCDPEKTVAVGDPVDKRVLDALDAVRDEELDRTKLDEIEKYVVLRGDPFATITLGPGDTESHIQLPSGYYLIRDEEDSQTGRFDAYTTYITVVIKDYTIQPKSVIPTVDKQVYEDLDGYAHREGWTETADHAVNESFQFALIGTIPENPHLIDYSKEYIVKFTDTMSEGVTFEDIAYVTVNDTEVPPDLYTFCLYRRKPGGGQHRQ